MDENLNSLATNHDVKGLRFLEFISRLLPEYIRKLKGHFKNDDHLGFTSSLRSMQSVSGSFLRFKAMSVRNFQKAGFWDKLGVLTYTLLDFVIFTGVSLFLLLYLITGTANRDIRGDGIMYALEYAVNILFITIYTPWALLQVSRFFWIIRHFFKKDWTEYNNNRTAQYGKVLDFDDIVMNRFVKGGLTALYYILWFILQITSVALLITTLDTLTMYGAFDKLFSP